jgi:hypothetical protein
MAAARTITTGVLLALTAFAAAAQDRTIAAAQGFPDRPYCRPSLADRRHHDPRLCPAARRGMEAACRGENRAGGNSAIGAQQERCATPDGYTPLVVNGHHACDESQPCPI